MVQISPAGRKFDELELCELLEKSKISDETLIRVGTNQIKTGLIKTSNIAASASEALMKVIERPMRLVELSAKSRTTAKLVRHERGARNLKAV